MRSLRPSSAPGRAFDPRNFPAFLINGPEAYTQRKWAEQQARRRRARCFLGAALALAFLSARRRPRRALSARP